MELPFNFMSQNKDPASEYAQTGYEQYGQEGMYNADGQYVQYNQDGYGTSDQANYNSSYYGNAAATYGENEQLYNNNDTNSYDNHYGGMAPSYDAYSQAAGTSMYGNTASTYSAPAAVPIQAHSEVSAPAAPAAAPVVPAAAPVEKEVLMDSNAAKHNSNDLI
eukprot:CAMPEP_0175087066 /NCGR_PEP_ID=MMETSP0052_2-20121109/29621_1 /TAXON_ID=51329 ORGANISM="Polytomella parva, Strain SAG 63-3" /NCGR_SAMPLE_ID=MMETSP0052_2 /ASSEMBLY_ACC=CAM_ASM_000194 /LENGTH=162 /DNA_ID=CAMNT_0016359365 /DNA_START=602 /DNA_END=1090 /DNA_ORIENTATION=-